MTGHAAAAGTEVLRVCRWNRTQSFLHARGRVRPKPPSDALRAIGTWRPAAGRIRFAVMSSRMRPELKGGGVSHHIAAQLAGGLPWGLWGAAGAAGGAVSESVFQGRTLASNRCAVCVVHFDDTVPFTMRSASFASSCSVYSLRMHPVA